MRAVVLHVLVLALLFAPVPGLVSAVSIDVATEWETPPSRTREFAFARRHLQQSFDGYGATDVFASAFGVVALSHFAAGLMNVYVAEPERRDELIPLLDEVARRARSPRVAPSELTEGGPIDASVLLVDHNLYFSHLAVILGIRRLVACGTDRQCARDPDADALQKRLVTHLRARSLASALFHAPSYPDSPMWPADQTVTLLALRLYDASHGTNLLDEPLEGFLGAMEAHTDPATGLHHSSVAPSFGDPPLSYATTPRGCAISWSTLYLAQVAPDVARAQYERYRVHMAADVLGFGGFREWPRDRSQGADVDSGPLVFGVGMAATALGLGPARIFGDADRYATIRRSALTFGAPSWIESHGYATAPVLGEAILFHGRTARLWFAPNANSLGSAPREVEGDATLATRRAPPSRSPVSLLVLVGYLGLIALWARRTLRRYRRARGALSRDLPRAAGASP